MLSYAFLMVQNSSTKKTHRKKFKRISHSKGKLKYHEKTWMKIKLNIYFFFTYIKFEADIGGCINNLS